MSLKNDAINLVVALKGFTLPSKDAELAYNKLCNQLSKNRISYVCPNCHWSLDVSNVDPNFNKEAKL